MFRCGLASRARLHGLCEDGFEHGSHRHVCHRDSRRYLSRLAGGHGVHHHVAFPVEFVVGVSVRTNVGEV